jgi:hypothetical protein
MQVVVTVLSVLAFATWLSAAIHGFRSLRHLSGKSSLGQMLFHGIRWFDADNFNPRGQELQRLFVRSFAGFFACIIALMVAAIFLTQ